MAKKQQPKKNVSKEPTATKVTTAANVGYEAELWRMADSLRGSMDAAEYKHVVLGLIFLKYISDALGERHDYLQHAVDDPKRMVSKDYLALSRNFQRRLLYPIRIAERTIYVTTLGSFKRYRRSSPNAHRVMQSRMRISIMRCVK